MISRRHFWSLASLPAFGSLHGCAARPKGNEACLTISSISTGFANCQQVYDIAYSFENGAFPVGTVPLRGISADVEANYVAQNHPNHCYAAALATTFRSQGINVSQERFVQALSSECFGMSDRGASLSQILFSATRVNAGNGIWPIDRPDRYFSTMFNDIADSGTKFSKPGEKDSNGLLKLPTTRKDVPLVTLVNTCQSKSERGGAAWATFSFNPENMVANLFGLRRPQLVQPPSLERRAEVHWARNASLYPVVHWHPTDAKEGDPVHGTYRALVDAEDTIDAIGAGATVMAGMATEEGSGHAVVISKVLVACLKDSGRPHPNYHVQTVFVADPSTPDHPISAYSGDAFFKSARFLLSMKNYQKTNRSARS
jgi:hypothetical protein